MAYSWLNYAIVANASFTLLGTLLTLIFIVVRHQCEKKTISTSLSLIITVLVSKLLLCIALIVLLTSTTSNHLTFLCRLKAYMAIVTNALLYCSFCFQSFYSLCQVRFSNNRILSRSKQFYMYMTVLILLLLTASNLPFLLIDGWIEYAAVANICYVSGRNMYSIIYFSWTMCLLPIFISSCYLWMILYVHWQTKKRTINSITQNQIISRQEKRNATVLKRIALVLATLVPPSLPTVALLIQFFAADSSKTAHTFLPSLFVGTTALTVSTVSSFYTRPELKNLVSGPNRT